MMYPLLLLKPKGMLFLALLSQSLLPCFTTSYLQIFLLPSPCLAFLLLPTSLPHCPLAFLPRYVLLFQNPYQSASLPFILTTALSSWLPVPLPTSSPHHCLLCLVSTTFALLLHPPRQELLPKGTGSNRREVEGRVWLGLTRKLYSS